MTRLLKMRAAGLPTSLASSRALLVAASTLLTQLHVALLSPTALGAQAPHAREPLPAWAYPVPEKRVAEPPPRESFVARSLPGTDVRLFVSQTLDRFDVGDWRPGEHPPMPSIVAHGSKPGVIACAYCHYPNGLGRPENSSIAGLPLEYIVAQVADMKSGLRTSAEPKMGPPAAMRRLAGAVDAADVREAAAYFAKLEPKKWVRVVETDSAPKMHVGGGGMFVRDEEAGLEALGDRILETAEDMERAAVRDPASGFVAFVPRGSVARGRKFVTTGGATGKPCAQCHGSDLRGVGVVPRIAGRSPSYITRQLYDMQSGARHGAGAAPMAEIVAKMTTRDMLAVSAYLATLAP